MPTTNNPPRPWIKRKLANQASSPMPQELPVNFYRMAAWRKLRARVLEAQPFCRECMSQQIVTPAQMVDHIQPIRLGGAPMDEANLNAMCNSCHAKKSNKERYL